MPGMMSGPISIIPVKRLGCLKAVFRAIMPPMEWPTMKRGTDGYLDCMSCEEKVSHWDHEIGGHRSLINHSRSDVNDIN